MDAWVGPLRDEGATDGFLLRVEDSAGNVGEVRPSCEPSRDRVATFARAPPLELLSSSSRASLEGL